MEAVTIKLGMASKYTITLGKPITHLIGRKAVPMELKALARAYAITMANKDALDPMFNGVNKTHAVVEVKYKSNIIYVALEVGKDFLLGDKVDCSLSVGRADLKIREFNPVTVVSYRDKSPTYRYASREDTRDQFYNKKDTERLKGKEHGVCNARACNSTEDVTYGVNSNNAFYCYHCATTMNTRTKVKPYFTVFEDSYFSSFASVIKATGEIIKVNEAPIKDGKHSSSKYKDEYLMTDHYYE